MIIVLRIAGRVGNRKKDEETLKRLKLDRKFSCVFVDEKDSVRKGMIESVKHMVAYGKVNEEFVKELEKKRGVKDKKVFHLHPPIGGFKKSSKVSAPKGILGLQKDIDKLVGRMIGNYFPKKSETSGRAL